MKPVAISLVSCRSADVVECPGQNPCCSAAGSRWMLTLVSMTASISFAAGQRSESGRYEVHKEEFFSGFGMGMTIYEFKIDGIRQCDEVIVDCSKVFNRLGSNVL